MKRVILNYSNKTSFVGMVSLAKELRKKKVDCILINEHGRTNNINASYQFKSNKINYLRHFPNLKKIFINCCQKNNALNLLVNTWKIFIWILKSKKRKYLINKILISFKPDAIFVYGDRHTTAEAELIALAKKYSIKIIIPPISVHTNKISLLNDIRCHNLNNILLDVTSDHRFKKKYPNHWIHDEKTSRDYSFYPKWMVLAMKIQGVLPTNPWIYGGGLSDIRCVFGKFDYELCMAEGIDYTKLKITGGIEDDKLFSVNKFADNIKINIRKKYFNNNKPIILISLPQLFEHGMKNYSENLAVQNLICSSLTSKGYNVLISLHPKMLRANYAFLEEKYDLKIAEEKLVNIISCAEIFIIGFPSSLVLWGVLMEIPTFMMTWYTQNTSEYNWIKGALKINEEDFFKNDLINFFSSNQNLNTMKRWSKKNKTKISPFDSKCVDRLISLI